MLAIMVIKLAAALIHFQTHPGQATPPSVHFDVSEDELRRVCQHKMKLYVDGMFALAYQYTPQQKDHIRARFEELIPQQIQRTKANLEARRRLMKEGQLLLKAGKTLKSPEVRALLSQVAELNKQDIVYREAEAQKVVEALLPPEQAQRGSARLAQLREEFWEGFFEKMKANDALRNTQEDGESGAYMMMQRDGWERYVSNFCNTLQLDATQRATTASSLREAVEKREQIKNARREEYMLIESNVTTQSRDLIARVNEVFNGLRGSLDRIPTAAQFEVAKSKAQGLRRSIPATRPSDLIRSSYKQDDPKLPVSQPAATATAPA